MGSTARRRSSHKASRKWQRQLVAIQARSDKTLTTLDSACDALHGLEREIEDFLTHYYEQVGASIERLTDLEQQLASLQQCGNTLPAPQSVPSSRLPGMDAEVKTLYRRLVRECHPDTAGEDAEKAEAIRNLNDAYAKRNIGELWKIHRELDVTNQALSATERLSRLKAHCERMQASLEAVEHRRMALEDSPAYALMQRAFQSKLCGQDFIENVRNHLHARIEQTKRDLVRAQMRQLRSALAG